MELAKEMDWLSIPFILHNIWSTRKGIGLRIWINFLFFLSFNLSDKPLQDSPNIIFTFILKYWQSIYLQNCIKSFLTFVWAERILSTLPFVKRKLPFTGMQESLENTSLRLGNSKTWLKLHSIFFTCYLFACFFSLFLILISFLLTVAYFSNK